MRRLRQTLGFLALFAAVWGGALGSRDLATDDLGRWSALLGFVALFVLPGAALDRWIKIGPPFRPSAPKTKRRRSKHWQDIARDRLATDEDPSPGRLDVTAQTARRQDYLERRFAGLSRWFAFSLGLLAAVECCVSILGGSSGVAALVLALVTLTLGLLPTQAAEALSLAGKADAATDPKHGSAATAPTSDDPKSRGPKTSGPRTDGPGRDGPTIEGSRGRATPRATPLVQATPSGTPSTKGGAPLRNLPPGRKPPAYVQFFQSPPASEPEPAEENVVLLPAGRPTSRGTAWSGLAMVIFLLVVLIATLMAVGGANVARDRTWYLAYITALAGDGSGLGMFQATWGGALDWSEPFFATGDVASRFTHNPWIAGLALWSWLTGAATPWVFATLAPLCLTPMVGASALALARMLFGPHRAAAPATIALLVVLTSAFPFFAPGDGLFYARIAEDKSVAVLILLPTITALLLSALRPEGHARAGLPAAALALLALGSTHALVYAIALITLVPALFVVGAKPNLLAPFDAPAENLDQRTLSETRRVRTAAAITIGLMAVLALPPALSGTNARSGILGGASASKPLVELARHPVIRAHLRMDRLHELETGGPIVSPTLLWDPLLLLALCGLPVGLRFRGRLWGTYLVITASAALAVAFVPFLAPTFGRIVLPWMAYRALWGVPFGFLLAALVLYAPRLLTTHWVSRGLSVVVLSCLVLGSSGHRLPWERLGVAMAQFTQAPSPPLALASEDPVLTDLLRTLSALPRSSVIAASRELSELIAALAGRSVVAMSDRATAVFAEDLGSAERRLQAVAALVAMPNAPVELQRGYVERFGITHVVLEGLATRDHDEIHDENDDAATSTTAPPCPAAMTSRFENKRYRVCATARGRNPSQAAPAGPAATSDGIARAQPEPGDAPSGTGAGVDAGAKSEAEIATTAEFESSEWRCTPHPKVDDGILRWKRTSRWTGHALAVHCQADIGTGSETPNRIAIAAELPRAREMLLYVLTETDRRGVARSRYGILDFDGSSTASILLPGDGLPDSRLRANGPRDDNFRRDELRQIELTLAPSFLPYLNLRRLDLVRGQ